MELGRVYSGCARCGVDARRSLLGDWRHDCRCWGWRTALANLWARLTWLPEDEDA